MARGWPPLELREILDILSALKFTYDGSRGGHDFYVGTRNGTKHKVTVDPKAAPFNEFLLQSMCKQAGCKRQEFYGATPKTASKIYKGKKQGPETIA